MSDLAGAIRTVLEQCLGVGADEDVVVVTDPARAPIARALVDHARMLGAECTLVEISERETHGVEPSPAAARAMARADVIVAPTTMSLSHTEARRLASDAGARVATMPQITEDMLARTMAVDFEAMKTLSQRFARALTEGNEVRIRTDRGTDLVLDVSGRAGIADDGDLRAAGAFGNLPAGEGFIAPQEGTARGRIVFDGSIWPLGLLTEPLEVEIEDGYITRLAGARSAEYEELLSKSGREAFAVAELGIGSNPAARLTGNVLEDEKILGTIHVAFGDNHSFGGTIRVASHQDGIVLEPTVEIDGRLLLDKGSLAE